MSSTKSGKNAKRMNDKSLRRHALSLASQLPDNEADALAIVSHVQQIVERFLNEGEAAAIAS